MTLSPIIKVEFIIDRKAREIMHLVTSVCLSVCVLTAEPFYLRPSSFAWGPTLTPMQKMKVVGQTKRFSCESANKRTDRQTDVQTDATK